jgi:hypothetical protein
VRNLILLIIENAAIGTPVKESYKKVVYQDLQFMVSMSRKNNGCNHQYKDKFQHYV